MRLLILIVISLLCLVPVKGQACSETSGTYRFRLKNESFEIPINAAGCDPVALELSWTNGRNNGANFVVTFLDSDNHRIYAKEIWGFMTGNFEFPFDAFESRPWMGGRSLISVPSKVTIQAVGPFALPASISYVVRRTAVRNSAPSSELDEGVALTLRTAPGKQIAKGNCFNANTGSAKREFCFAYKLEEVTLPSSVSVDLYGKKETIETAYRLTLNRAPLPTFDLIWIDDAPLRLAWRNGNTEAIALIYDASILRDGAVISVSNSDGTGVQALTEHLTLAARVISPSVEPGNEIVSIHRAARLIGSTRHDLIQIELKTNRAFPPKNTPLRLLIGKRFFLEELSGDQNGRTLTLTITMEMFAELKQGAEIVALYQPDRSGFSGKDIWYFGRLDKSLLR